MSQLPHHLVEDIPIAPANRAAIEQARALERSEALLAGEAAIDEAIEMTFPASDPPAWSSSHRDLTSDIEPDTTAPP